MEEERLESAARNSAGRERRAERRMRLLRAHGLAELKKVAFGFATTDVERVIFQPLQFPIPLSHLSLPLCAFLRRIAEPINKKRKNDVDNFFNFCGSVACLLLFIILKRQKPSFVANITLPTSLELIVSNYSVFLFHRYQNSC